VFNVIDKYASSTGVTCYYTDQGRITMYIKKLSGASTNKVFLDFNHNYKYITANVSASISNIGLSGTGNALSVSYSKSNGVWQRCSGGKTIN